VTGSVAAGKKFRTTLVQTVPPVSNRGDTSRPSRSNDRAAREVADSFTWIKTR
jgi:hypothetical protein